MRRIRRIRAVDFVPSFQVGPVKLYPLYKVVDVYYWWKIPVFKRLIHIERLDRASIAPHLWE